ncbi:tRNA nucleotidyltransferase [hydrothermal vent metagenome]|uniref:tRNA nucleotidyltransferase n=1 Tax=hydrothermal vent metagenome TaxID=652676 RepID=A0A1W1CW39_9ZZZZ
MYVPQILEDLAQELHRQNAKAILVGGAVRDYFLTLDNKDYDVEVYGLQDMNTLIKILANHGSVNLVGKSFGVLKFSYGEDEYDFSFPRQERKIAEGHRGFEIQINGDLSFKEASRRRDFTINAIGYDILEKTFLDPFEGLEDIKKQTLRHIDSKTFVEDPLRVYRAVQFVARFEYALADETFALCQKMREERMLEELAKERIYMEWTKLLLKAPKPSLGFELMRSLGIVEQYFPELYALIGVVQSPKWHPEGDVWIHTMMCVDAMAKICREADYSQKEKLLFFFAILCHDLGKATHTQIDKEGNIRALGHEEAGLAPTKSFMYRLSDEHDFIQALLPLVEHHLKPSQFYRGKAKASAFRRLATKVNIEMLIIVAKADFLGRTTEESLKGIYHAGIWMLEKSKSLKVHQAPLDNLLQGRDLIALGLKPSKEFKVILDEVYQRQLLGELESWEDTMVYVRNIKEKNVTNDM